MKQSTVFADKFEFSFESEIPKSIPYSVFMFSFAWYRWIDGLVVSVKKHRVIEHRIKAYAPLEFFVLKINSSLDQEKRAAPIGESPVRPKPDSSEIVYTAWWVAHVPKISSAQWPGNHYNRLMIEKI